MKSQLLVLARSPIARSIHFSAIKRVSRPSAEIDSIIRVDHAGELGADRIYAGQMAVLGNTKMGPVIQHMWDQEKAHKAAFDQLVVKHRVRPTAMVPIWNVAGYLLGAGTALMGEKAAMACTVAVESVIVDHYNDQLRTLMAEPEKNKELLETIQKFRDEEQEHHDCGLDHGAEKAPFYSALSEVIKLGCKTAIAISKGLFSDRNRINPTFVRTYSTTGVAKEEPTDRKWDLYGAVCLERKPLVLKNLNRVELKYRKMVDEIEFEKSHKSDHELRHEKDLELAAKYKSSDKIDEVDLKAVTEKTAADFEDESNEEYERFRFPPRITEADEKNDVKSTKRKLDSHLLLLINQKLGGKKLWLLPQGIRKNEETLRQTAERVLREKCGDALKVAFLGNSPCGFYKYNYPSSLNSESAGAKVFFFKAIYLSGQVNLPENLIDFRWATRSEMGNLLTSDRYYNKVRMFLIDDDDESDASEKAAANRAKTPRLYH